MIKRSWTKDFLGGIDPTGAYTFRYGVRDVDKDKKQQALRRTLGVTGGVIGGGLAVPSVISGIMGLGSGLLGLKKGKGWSNVARQAWTGFKKPVGVLYRGARSLQGVRGLQAGRRLSMGQQKSLRSLMSSMKGELPTLGSQKGMTSFIDSAVERLVKGKASPKELSVAKELLKKKMRGAAAGIGLSGAITGGSSFYQYGQGRRLGGLMTPEQRKKV